MRRFIINEYGEIIEKKQKKPRSQNETTSIADSVLLTSLYVFLSLFAIFSLIFSALVIVTHLK